MPPLTMGGATPKFLGGPNLWSTDMDMGPMFHMMCPFTSNCTKI